MLTLWKALVIPRIDYCSQLWNPHKVGLIKQLEEIQKSFVKKIYGCRNKNYWEILADLKLYSLQRRRERYQIIYIWAIMENMVPNFQLGVTDAIVALHNARQGRKCLVRTVKKTPFEALRYSSLPIHGARLFNSLPKEIRSTTRCKKEIFKR